ncbi:glutathione S-transferase family protein [Paracoccus sp. (in: a-proteobacteria)]|uniref:glutathione S-transferase family protein n=1 Tax=Paracoccus sp. TaxID=267 RepID=UPI0026DF303C|nr:glutathione S-transferase family protein [Paracoccus sp. (in: a-proteobacteria)]MDO5647103.1 glutathione S-transferase family protein [Paracoccus sp. (in: a-proteobacteria)]
MLTLFHAPGTRSTSMVQLLLELGAADQVQIELVTIPRRDGSGGADAKNPHPEKKVPFLTDGHDSVRERSAITLYLTDRFPARNLGRAVGDPQRGEYLSWLFWYQGVLEPLAMLRFAGLDHPVLKDTYRDYDTAIAKLDDVLRAQPYLLGDDFSAADLVISGLFAWMGDHAGTTDAIKAWITRCTDRDSYRRVTISAAA